MRLVWICLVSTLLGLVAADPARATFVGPYDYPFVNPLVATVVGTPPANEADVDVDVVLSHYSSANFYIYFNTGTGAFATPVILPAVAGVKLQFGKVFYLPLLALHLSLAVRLAGGAADFHLRAQGALFNALAIVLFAATAVGAALAWRQRQGPRRVSKQRS